MASTKENWKETGRDLGHAFKGLGKTLLKTAKTGVNKATEWAESDDNDNSEVVADVEATVSEDNKSE